MSLIGKSVIGKWGPVLTAYQCCLSQGAVTCRLLHRQSFMKVLSGWMYHHFLVRKPQTLPSDLASNERKLYYWFVCFLFACVLLLPKMMHTMKCIWYTHCIQYKGHLHECRDVTHVTRVTCQCNYFSFLYLEPNSWNHTLRVETDQDCLLRDLKALRAIQGLQEEDFSCVDLPLKFNQVRKNIKIFSLPEIP